MNTCLSDFFSPERKIFIFLSVSENVFLLPFYINSYPVWGQRSLRLISMCVCTRERGGGRFNVYSIIFSHYPWKFKTESAGQGWHYLIGVHSFCAKVKHSSLIMAHVPIEHRWCLTFLKRKYHLPSPLDKKTHIFAIPNEDVSLLLLTFLTCHLKVQNLNLFHLGMFPFSFFFLSHFLKVLFFSQS